MNGMKFAYDKELDVTNDSSKHLILSRDMKESYKSLTMQNDLKLK